jgi:hypothetical protein
VATCCMALGVSFWFFLKRDLTIGDFGAGLVAGDPIEVFWELSLSCSGITDCWAFKMLGRGYGDLLES